jgi:hypothetical protein
MYILLYIIVKCFFFKKSCKIVSCPIPPRSDQHTCAQDYAANSVDLQERKDAQYVAGVMAAKQRFGLGFGLSLGMKHKLVTIV